MAGSATIGKSSPFETLRMFTTSQLFRLGQFGLEVILEKGGRAKPPT